MELDPVLLARIQFAFTVSFHIIFPAFTIGLASWIAVLEGRWLYTGKEIYKSLSEYWTKIFAVSFGMGVVSGIVMSYQFGTNWSRYSYVGGYVLGPLINYEVVTAFFLEATFLGVLLFGRDRVPKRVHFFAACMVAFGTLMSAFWILSANSFMQTPQGHEIRDGILYPVDWWQIVFNPSFPYRYFHMVIACYLTTSFVVAGVSAWHLLKGQFQQHARIGLSMALGLIAVLAPVQAFVGDLTGLNTLEHQPTKLAAMEGHWETHKDGAPLILFAIPDQEREMNHYEIAIPKLGSLILTHSWDGEIRGLKEWPKQDRPPVWIVFWGFRLMVGLGLIMIALGLYSLWLRFRKRLYDTRWYLWSLVLASPIGFFALTFGWFTTEVGRQPWTVYGILRTADSVTPALTGAGVLASLITFFVVYLIVFTAGTYYLVRLFQRGPAGPVKAAEPAVGRPKRPMSKADEEIEMGAPHGPQPSPAE
ncbi:cytochrome ubiquinol oxidase subunit I [Aerophototrophica crusticola]|uniref:Cytochrome ubiquinol oxidase subunit I n=1 Tax=Aerophototrophica crusticola TaxID=1709002 RepID=A0A858R709_9PROT|nr:cytochrome ubiquinol oxidase subunit I [Rhodospirillaceae bacterium B3]